MSVHDGQNQVSAVEQRGQRTARHQFIQPLHRDHRHDQRQQCEGYEAQQNAAEQAKGSARQRVQLFEHREPEDCLQQVPVSGRSSGKPGSPDCFSAGNPGVVAEKPG